MVDSLEDLLIDLVGTILLEGDLHHQEGVSKTLDANTNWSVSHVGFLCLSARIVVVVDNSVKVLGDNLGDFVKLFKVKLALTNEARK